MKTCQKTVPEAIIAFLESKDFEDAIRNAVSLGGDTDTLGAITGSIAEAYYGIPEWLMSECRHRINKEMIDILDEFDRTLTRKDVLADTNKLIEKAIDQYYVQANKDGMILFMDSMMNAMKQGEELIIPYITTHSFLSDDKINNMSIGDTFTLDQDVKLKIETVKDAKGKEWLGVFTSTNEMHKGSSGNVQIN